MSAVLCLPACLCVSAAASRGQAPPRERVKSVSAFLWGALATERCGGHAQASRQAKHCAHRGILMLLSCDKAFQDPCHSETREQKYVQQHIRICTYGAKTALR